MTNERINGVDVEALGQIITAIKADPGVADFEFRSSTEWDSGAVVRSVFTGHKQHGVDATRTTPHELGGDEPPELLGTGKHVGPAGHLLHAMSHCFTVTTAYHGAARGVKIDALRVDAQGSLDLQGMLGLNEKVRPGFKHIHLRVHIDSPNSSADVYDLFQFAQGHSPICTSVAQPVPLTWEFEIEPSQKSPDTADDRHGVNFNNLSDTIQAVKDNAVLGKCTFFASTEWLGGAKVRSTHPGFDQAEGDLLVRHREQEPKSYIGDEPTQLLGSDEGPSPSETLLHAMASCVSVNSSYHAAARGIPFDAFEVKLEGDMDLQGFTDLDDNVTPAYKTIRAKVRMKAGGSPRDLEDFLEFATSHSPICNSVCKPVHVTYSLVHNGQVVGASGPHLTAR